MSPSEFEPTRSNSYSTAPGLADGVCYWTVRGLEPERASTAVSKTVAFRLITRPLLRPPELFDPSLEFIDAQTASAPR